MKRIAVINDLSGFGRCSLSVALPIISALGLECCPVPTAILSNQTGYDSYHCIDLTSELCAYSREWKKLGYKFDAIMTGYMASPEQADLILNFINEFKTENTKLIVDPIMADGGKLYSTYSRELCKKVIMLSRKADIITPNLTELCILTGTNYEALISRSKDEDYVKIISETAKALLTDTLKSVIVTGVIHSGSILNILVEKDNTCVTASKIYGGSYSGTGDIFASIISAEAAKGTSLVYAVELASKFLEKSIKSSFNEGTDRNDGVNFQKFLRLLTDE